MHHYRITVEPMDTDSSAPTTTTASALQFEVTNHDDVLALVERIRQRTDIGADAAAFTVGLKLFSEVILKHRKLPLFQEFMPHLGGLIKKLKGGSPAPNQLA